MTFGNPWLLLGALGGADPAAGAPLRPAAAAAPSRSRPIAFVLRSQKRTAVAAQAQAAAALHAAHAHPPRHPARAGAARAAATPRRRPRCAQGPAATAIVLDASLSMRCADGRASFERGRDEARDALKDLLARRSPPRCWCALRRRAAAAHAPGLRPRAAARASWTRRSPPTAPRTCRAAWTWPRARWRRARIAGQAPGGGLATSRPLGFGWKRRRPR